jgi:hypothetical protein
MSANPHKVSPMILHGEVDFALLVPEGLERVTNGEWSVWKDYWKKRITGYLSAPFTLCKMMALQ